MHLKLITIFLFTGLISACSSPPVKPKSCSYGRTLLDGTCVSHDVADYVGCIRAQGAELSVDRKDSLSADIGYFGAKVGGVSEFSEKLTRKYSASDDVMMEIVKRCDRIARVEMPSPTKVSKKPPKLIPVAQSKQKDMCNGKIDMPLDCAL